MMKVGEFLVDPLQAEELTGFVIHSFSLLPEKVSSITCRLQWNLQIMHTFGTKHLYTEVYT